MTEVNKSASDAKLHADNGGLRYDAGKPMMHLIPPDAMLELAKVYARACTPMEGYPEGKYPKRNWERGMDWSRVTDSLERHLAAFKMGEDIDMETSLLHTAQIVWNAVALLTYQLRGIGVDDRHKVKDIGCVSPGTKIEFPDAGIFFMSKEGLRSANPAEDAEPLIPRRTAPVQTAAEMAALEEKLRNTNSGAIIEVSSALMDTIKYSPPVRDVRASKEDNFHSTGSDVAPVERTRERNFEIGSIFTCFPDKPYDRWKIMAFDGPLISAQSLRDPTRSLNMHQNAIWHIFDKEEIAKEEASSHRCMHCSSDALPEKQTCAECGE